MYLQVPHCSDIQEPIFALAAMLKSTAAVLLELLTDVVLPLLLPHSKETN